MMAALVRIKVVYVWVAPVILAISVVNSRWLYIYFFVYFKPR